MIDVNDPNIHPGESFDPNERRHARYAMLAVHTAPPYRSGVALALVIILVNLFIWIVL